MALYHKHRPQDFSFLIGQEHIVETISSQIAQNKLAHAYLFSGPRGVGKTTTARIIAKAANCTGKQIGAGSPCNNCDACKSIIAGTAIDVLEIDAASHTGVDNVRTNIIENAQFRPTRLKHKVFIIDEVHMLSTSAFNALLKIMEEPPAHVMFILATTELHKIPDTIISRCQHFGFSRVSAARIAAHLADVAKEESISVDQAVLDRIAAKSDGCVRDSLSLLDQLFALGETHITEAMAARILPAAGYEQMTAFFSALLSQNAEHSLTELHTLTGQSTDIALLMDDTIALLRFCLLTRYQPSSAMFTHVSAETASVIRDWGKRQNTNDLLRLIDILLRRKSDIKSAPIPELPLELAILEWCDNTAPIVPMVVAQHTNTTPKSSSSIASTNIAISSSPADIVPPQANETTVSATTPHIPPVAALSSTPSQHSGTTISLSTIERNWQKIMDRIEAESPSLTFILKSAKLVRLTDNQLTISVAFSFHQDKLMTVKSRTHVERIMSDIIGLPVLFNVIVPENNAPKNNDLQELASLVGGDIV